MRQKTTLKPHAKPAFTLVECLLSAAILVVVVCAAMAFHYHTIVSAQLAEDQLLAARSAYLLSEAWRGAKADEAFDPTQQDFDDDFQIEKMSLFSVPMSPFSGKLPFGLMPLGVYRINLDNKEFYANLSYGAMAGVPHLRSIHVLIIWQDARGMRHEYYLPTLSQT